MPQQRLCLTIVLLFLKGHLYLVMFTVGYIWYLKPQVIFFFPHTTTTTTTTTTAPSLSREPEVVGKDLLHTGKEIATGNEEFSTLHAQIQAQCLLKSICKCKVSVVIAGITKPCSPVCSLGDKSCMKDPP